MSLWYRLDHGIPALVQTPPGMWPIPNVPAIASGATNYCCCLSPCCNYTPPSTDPAFPFAGYYNGCCDWNVGLGPDLLLSRLSVTFPWSTDSQNETECSTVGCFAYFSGGTFILDRAQPDTDNCTADSPVSSECVWFRCGTIGQCGGPYTIMGWVDSPSRGPINDNDLTEHQLSVAVFGGSWTDVFGNIISESCCKIFTGSLYSAAGAPVICSQIDGTIDLWEASLDWWDCEERCICRPTTWIISSHTAVVAEILGPV